MGKRPLIVDLFERDLLAFWRASGLSKKAFTDKYHFSNRLFSNAASKSVSLETIEKGYGIFHDGGLETLRDCCDVLFLAALMGERASTQAAAADLKARYEDAGPVQ